MTSPKEIKSIFYRYLNDQHSEADLNKLLDYFDTDAESGLLREMIVHQLQQEDQAVENSAEVDDLLERVDSSLYDILRIKQNKIRRIKIFRITAVAAMLLIAVSAGLLFVLDQKPVISRQSVNNIKYQDDVIPGGNKAILTLANGKKISLTDAANGTIAQQGGIKVTKAANGKLILQVIDAGFNHSNANKLTTIETPRGGQYQIDLPDGSKVWLNAASRVQFANSFAAADERRVKLSGEAYFEVVHDDLKPFRVETDKQMVEDIGTHFNINCYADEPATKTSLLEGSARVTSRGKGNMMNDIVLKPNQQSSLTANKINVQIIDPETVIDWKNGEFVFAKENLQEILRKISRWYDVEIDYQDYQSSETFSGRVSRFSNVSAILRTIELTGEVHFKVEGKKITVL